MFFIALFANSILFADSGDIEIERGYKVDRRYREDILNEIQGSDYSEDKKKILDSYLRKIIR